jgi:teichuronic acid biosynthesis glycosyltransferase TuaG
MALLEPTIDVVIPTYCETERLFRAIESALNQSRPTQKVIVVDDGSPVEVRDEIANRYSSDERVQLVFADHLGHPGKVRNLGVHKSSADWIALLDADDYWERDKLQRQLTFAQETNADLIYTNSVNIAEKSKLIEKRTGSLPKNLDSRGLILNNYLVNSSVLVRRDALKYAGNFVESPKVLGVEDYATWLRISLNGKLAGLDEPLVYYTVSESSLSRRPNGRTRADALEDFLVWLDSNTPLSSKKVGIGIFTRAVLWKERFSGKIRRTLQYKV